MASDRQTQLQEDDVTMRAEQMEAVAEIVAAGATLLLDWQQGSVQRVRISDCGFGGRPR